MAGDRTLCAGCRDDYYNAAGNSTTGQCWSLKDAEVVIRYRIGWWTAPTEPGALTKVRTNSCHYATGWYAHYKKVPSFAVGVREAGSAEARRPMLEKAEWAIRLRGETDPVVEVDDSDVPF